MLNHTAPRKIIGVVASAFLLLLVGCSAEYDEEKGTATMSADLEIDASNIEISVLDFNSGSLPAGTQSEGATTKLVAAGNATDGQALDISFSPDSEVAIVSFQPEKAWDWTGFGEFNIAIDAKNTGTESVHLFIRVEDAQGAMINRSVSLAKGESNTYFAILNGLAVDVDTGLRENPVPWETSEEMFIVAYNRGKLNLGEITKLSLYVRGIVAEKHIVVDNIRLRHNPKYDLSYLEGIIDEFGQAAKSDFPIKVHSDEELKKAADDELAALAASGPLADRSRFGGWKDGPKLEATGFFRTEKVDGKWWLVDPEGYLFFSNGLANVRMANGTSFTGVDFRDPSIRYVDPEEVTPEDSIGLVQVSEETRETRFISSELRHNIFAWLPDYHDELANHYSFRRSTHNGPLDGGETFSFYQANLERRYGETGPESFLRKWEEVTLDRMLDWGFTSMGNWVDPAFYPNEKVPYFANGWIIGEFATLSTSMDIWAPMPDFFDPEFVRRAEITIRTIAEEIQESPWCVGVFVDNEKSWGRPSGTVEERFGLILDAFSKEAVESPAKRAFIQYLSDAYGSIETLNQRWKSSFGSWESLSPSFTLPTYTDEATSDLSTLLGLLSEEYFRVVHDTLEKHLPDHLYMGVRMASWGMPKETVAAAVKYSDVLSFNIYDEGLQTHAWSFLHDIDLPSIIGEWHIGAISDSGMFHPGLVMAENQEDRAAMYKVYMESVAAHNTMVGAHWFQYIDSPVTGRAHDGENYNIGFVSNTDIPYPEMVKAAREFNTSLYPKRYEDKP